MGWDVKQASGSGSSQICRVLVLEGPLSKFFSLSLPQQENCGTNDCFPGVL
jgi:hypothetical protein